MEDSRTAARAMRKARQDFARHIAAKAEERTARGSARYERKGRGLRARVREALTIAELLDLSDPGALA